MVLSHTQFCSSLPFFFLLFSVRNITTVNNKALLQARLCNNNESSYRKLITSFPYVFILLTHRGCAILKPFQLEWRDWKWSKSHNNDRENAFAARQANEQHHYDTQFHRDISLNILCDGAFRRLRVAPLENRDNYFLCETVKWGYSGGGENCSLFAGRLLIKLLEFVSTVRKFEMLCGWTDLVINKVIFLKNVTCEKFCHDCQHKTAYHEAQIEVFSQWLSSQTPTLHIKKVFPSSF